ncbi:MAG: IclR family transcriptional regulator, partial [Chloroflexota bacterium]|nr:IclR family transcriptional regulator [Chloroflexota bacterium]
MSESGTGTVVRAVARALDLLEIICKAEHPLSVQEATERSGLAISTTHRLLRTLMECGYVEQNEHSREYEPGLKIFELAHAVTQRLFVIEQAKRTMDELAATCNETVHLAVLDHDEVVYLDKRESQRPVRMYSAVGKRGPAYCTGVGKVLLAYLPPEQLHHYLSSVELNHHTERTITDRDELRNHLLAVREQGVAIDDREHEDAIRCVACPV